MKEENYLSEVCSPDEFLLGVLNVIKTPTGSGKTTFALEVLGQSVEEKKEILYLIDTINGREQILNRPNTQVCNLIWLEAALGNTIIFEEQKIVIMTYASFGSLAKKYPSFGFNFKYIVCDEIHNLVNFRFFSPNTETNYHVLAANRLESIISKFSTIVVGLTATPDVLIEKTSFPVYFIEVEGDLRDYETEEVIRYRNIKELISNLDSDKKGIIYICRITQMKEIEQLIREKGISVISIWSINNKDHCMNDEQKAARQYLLDKQAMPPQYQIIILNASSETSINIYGQVDYMIIHTQEEDVRTQVRGRYREDLKTMYVFDKENAAFEIPVEFMGRKLFKEERDMLCGIINKINKDGRLEKWPTIKDKLIEAGYSIKEGQSGKRYAVITQK